MQASICGLLVVDLQPAAKCRREFLQGPLTNVRTAGDIQDLKSVEIPQAEDPIVGDLTFRKYRWVW